MQITTGFRSILSHPIAYTGFQYLMGAHQGWKIIVNEYIKAKSGDAILDIGCGPADTLNYLGNVEYWGFDISPQYIKRAKNRFNGRGHFKCKLFEESDLLFLPKFDVVLLSGVLHHLDYIEAKGLVKLTLQALKSGGRLVTVDPCFTARQNRVARYLIEHDRGQNVRDELGYRSLVEDIFQHVEVDVIHKIWIPYTHCYMTCTRK